jgi:hypothetical protein
MAQVSVIMPCEIPIGTSVTRDTRSIGKVIQCEPYRDEGKFLVTMEVEDSMVVDIHYPPYLKSSIGCN